MAPHRALNAESPLRPTRSSKTGDEFKYQLEVYSVTGIQAGHDEFDAVLLADLIGEKGLWGAVRKFGRTSQNIRFAGKTEFVQPIGES